MVEYGNRIRVHEGVDYAANPNFAMAPAWAKMMTGIYETRFKLVNEARSVKLIKDTFNNEFRLFNVENGIYVADKLVPVKETLTAFKGMTIEDCVRYHEAVDKHSADFKKACK